MSQPLPYDFEAEMRTSELSRILARRLVKATWLFFKEHGYAMYLGGALGAQGFKWDDWRIYVIMLPVYVLVVWKSDYRRQS